MQLVNDHKRALNFSSYGFAILVLLISFICPIIRADYDCSAKDDGWYYDPEFCHIYWRCTHGTAEEFECASGTAWDHHNNRCNWLDSVDCSRAETTTTEQISSDEENSDDGGKNDDGDNEEEEEEEPVVVVKKKSKSSRKRKMNDNEDDDDNDEQSTTSRKKTTTEPIASGTDIVQLTQGKDSSGIECQPTGIYTIADLNECNSYYQCDRGVRTRLNCPERELYDANKHQCLDYERVACGSRAVNLADKNQCVNKRDGIHPDTERDCRFYYQCVGQNKMREAKCPGDQKFSSYTGKCGPANSAPIPCGTYIPGSANIPYQQNFGLVICIVLFITIFFF